jgi:peptidoglycan hydrolase CwlO-like protein
MKKILAVLSLALLLFACGTKSGEAAKTPEQEVQTVDSVAQELNAETKELADKVDSVQSEVDSLLQGI